MKVKKIKDIYKENNISEIILRLSLVGLLLYFGFSQILNPKMWTSYIDFQLSSFLSDIDLVLLNGAMEIFFAILILFRVFLKISATLMALHIFIIAVFIGFNPTGVRDVVISGAFLSLAFMKNNTNKYEK